MCRGYCHVAGNAAGELDLMYFGAPCSIFHKVVIMLTVISTTISYLVRRRDRLKTVGVLSSEFNVENRAFKMLSSVYHWAGLNGVFSSWQ